MSWWLVSAERSLAEEIPAMPDHYRVPDRIPLGPFTIRTTYVARLRILHAGRVVAEARQFPRVRLHSTVMFDPIEAGTRVVERMRIEAPRPLAALTTREAVKAHIAVRSGIRSFFEER